MSWWDVLLITIAGPAASGMSYYSVKLPGIYPGGNMVFAFLLGALLWVFPVFLIAIYASSFPRSGAMYVVISRVTHPLLGFLPNWLWIISSGMYVGFANYIGLNLISAALLTSGEISDSDSLRNAGEWLGGNWTRLWIAAVLTLILWFMEAQGMDRLKWFIRICIYVPLVVTFAAIIIMFVADGQGGWDAVYGAGSYDAVLAVADKFGIGDAMMSSGEALSGMMLGVFWAYSALESISFVGSEVKTPRTSFLRGMGIGICAVCFLYCMNAFAPGFSYGSDFIRDYSWLYNNEDPAAVEALQAAMGGATPPVPSVPFYTGVLIHQTWFAITLGVGFFLWYFNTAIVVWMAAVRGLFAMAFDRQLPLSWCAVSKRGTPTTATHIIGIVALLSIFIGYGDAVGGETAGVMLAILDFTALFFIWPVGLAGIFLPYTRPDLFEKSTFQYKWGNVPVVSILGVIVLGVGWWTVFMVGLELSTTYSQVGLAALICLGYAIVAWMYNRNRKEGIDPNQIFTAIPPS
jgi:amino acid transporter